jgi:AcrR family transcriptional regulator
MTSPISYRVVELVRAHIGTPYVRATDSDVSRALGVSRGAIYEYKADKARMSPVTAARALELLGGAAHEATPLLQELMREQARTESEGAIWRYLMRAAEAVRDKAAVALFVVVAATVAAGMIDAPHANHALAALLLLPVNIHYASLAALALIASLALSPQVWRGFLLIFPITLPATDATVRAAR